MGHKIYRATLRNSQQNFNIDAATVEREEIILLKGGGETVLDGVDITVWLGSARARYIMNALRSGTSIKEKHCTSTGPLESCPTQRATSASRPTMRYDATECTIASRTRCSVISKFLSGWGITAGVENPSMLKGDVICLRFASKVGPPLEGFADFELAEWEFVWTRRDRDRRKQNWMGKKKKTLKIRSERRGSTPRKRQEPAYQCQKTSRN
ncbi:hypothetical protein B0H13DRAFT_1864338 [Mycena leptocephala]|nr:hypothetical protein B0H13DRAFT_1864338 [Mycena leptocephala]